jgi:lipopolysaccharide export system permease protein
MSRLTRYITRLIVVRWLVVLGGLTAFVLALDLLDAADRVMAGRVPDPRFLSYVVMRAPGLMIELAPIAALLATLLAYGRLIRRGELVAMWNCGISPLRQLVMALPVGIALAVVQFALADRAVPTSLAALRDWGVARADMRERGRDEAGYMWLHKGRDIVRLRAAGDTRLDGVWLFRRDAGGLLVEQIHARGGMRKDGGWRLIDVRTLTPDGAPAGRRAGLDWNVDLTAADLALLALPADQLSLVGLIRLAAGGGWRAQPDFLYATRAHYRLAGALSPLLLTLLVVAMAQHFRRAGLPLRLSLGAIAFGLGYLTFATTALFLGEAGLIPALLAAWGPPGALALAVGGFAIRAE